MADVDFGGQPAGYGRRDASDPAPVFAALDLGTNNCRLLVARAANGSFQVIDAFSRIVRLGERLAATGALNIAAMERSIEALHVCAAKLRRRSVTVSRSYFAGVSTSSRPPSSS